VGAQSQAIVASLAAKIEHAAKALVLEFLANLIAATPVDTGWARANWIPSIGSPATSAVGTPQAVSTSEQTAGQAAVLQFVLDQAVMYVSNHVPYITVLNYGHSKQAPALFVEFCIDQALHTVQQRFGVDTGALRAANASRALG
jgi:hypothetical protein